MPAPKPFLKKQLPKPETAAAIKELYPGLTSEEEAEAEFFLLRYLEIALQIYERTKN